jgi:soluble lytic murein transglycosylase-like protein
VSGGSDPIRSSLAGAAGATPIESGSATPTSPGSSRVGNAPEAARLAKATREFQALFLMELMKPMTEALSQTSITGEEGNNTNDLYSWFWGEALADHLGSAWPLPTIPGQTSAAAASLTAGAALSGSASAIALPLNLPGGNDGIPLTGLSGARTGARTGISLSGQAASSVAGSRSRAAVSGHTAAPITPAAPPAPSEAKGALNSLITRASRLFKLPVNLVRAVIAVESGGRTNVVSHRGALGLMQVMPNTAKEMGARNLLDPWENLYAGVKYLSRQLERFGSLEEALAAYNAGPGAVEAHQGVPPYQETRSYIRRVLETKARLDQENPQDA